MPSKALRHISMPLCILQRFRRFSNTYENYMRVIFRVKCDDLKLGYKIFSVPRVQNFNDRAVEIWQ